MNLDRVGSGVDIPDDFNVIIEIPMNVEPIRRVCTTPVLSPGYSRNSDFFR